jgi:hypothetical protein
MLLIFDKKPRMIASMERVTGISGVNDVGKVKSLVRDFIEAR